MSGLSDLTTEEVRRLRTACAAVLNGVIWDGFNGPTGLSKDEALDFATELADWVLAKLEEAAGGV